MAGKQGANGQGERADGKMNGSQGRPSAQDEEQLSAYLDGELNAVERAALERRLAQDATLRRALGELRQTRALLRALPTPALPRSFALPEVGALDATASAHARNKANRDAEDDASASGALRTIPRVQVYRRDAGAPRPIPRATRTARVAQWLGSLVAVLGLALLLGATLPAHAPSIGAGASTAASREHSPAISASTTPGGAVAGPGNPTSTQTATFGSNTTQGAATSATASNAPTTTSPMATATASVPSGGVSAPPPLEQAWLSALGVLLLVGGVILFAYGRFARPRQ